MRVAAGAEADAFEQLVGACVALRGAARRPARAGSRRARERSARPRARASSAGRRSRSSASGSRAAAQPPSAPTSTPATRTEPADGTVEAGDDPQQRRLPGPARPEHDAELTLLDGKAEPLQRGDAAFRRGVDAEDVVELRRVRSLEHLRARRAPAPRTPAASPAGSAPRQRARRRRPRPTTTSASTSSTSGGSGAVARAVRPTRSVTTAASARPASAPARSPAAATVSARRRTIRRSSDGDAPCASRSSSSPLLVAQVAEHRQQDPGERQAERDDGSNGQREQRPVRDRIAPCVGLERAARLDREHVERLRGQRAIDLGRRVGVAQPQPDLVHPGRARPREIDGGRERCAVPDDRLAVDAREAADRPDHAHGHPLAGDLEREQAGVVRGGGQTRRREHRQRRRRLPRPDPRRDGVGERVANGRAVDPRAADTDPVGDAAGDVRELDRHRPGHRLARVGAPLLNPGVRLDRDPGEPAAACLRRQRVAERRLGRTDRSDLRSRRRAAPGRRRSEPAASGRAAGRSGPGSPRSRPPAVAATPASRCRASRSGARARRDRCPSSVIPLSPSSRPTPPVRRSTGAASTPGSAPKRRDRRRVLHRDQPPQVFADDVVERHLVRRLVALAAGQRRPVALGEEREPEADDEESGGRDRVARVAGERERCDPEPERAAAGEPLDEPERRPEQPGDEDGRGERDERRQQAAARSPSPSPRVTSSTTSTTAATAAASRSAEPGPRGPRRDHADEDGGRRGRHDDRERDPFAGEDAACEHVGRPGRRLARATTAPPSRPTTSPIAVPRTARAADSATVTSASCQPRAPYQASRRRVASRSGRSVIAASSAKAKSSAAASPPTTPSRRPAARVVACASRSSSTGASRSNENEPDWSSERAVATSAARSSISQSRGAPARSGDTQA